MNEDRPAPLAVELVLEFRGSRVETEDEIVEIEDALVEILAGGDTLMDHEIEPEARRIVIGTRDAPATLRHLLPFLERADLVSTLSAHVRSEAFDARVSLWPPDRPSDSPRSPHRT